MDSNSPSHVMAASAFESQPSPSALELEAIQLELSSAALNVADPSRSSSASGSNQQHPNVFVRGLPLAWSEAEITAVFQQYGQLSSLRLVRHSVTKQSLG